MSSLGDLAEPFEHQLLTLGEAAQVGLYVCHHKPESPPKGSWRD